MKPELRCQFLPRIQIRNLIQTAFFMSIFRVDLNFQEMKKDKEVVMAAVLRPRIDPEMKKDKEVVKAAVPNLVADSEMKKDKEGVVIAVQISRSMCRMFGV